MKIAYFDCFAGISGDMILGALVDAGLEYEQLQADLAKLPLDGYQLEINKVQKQGIGGTKVNVKVDEGHHHRHLSDIRRIIMESSLPEEVKRKSIEIFTRLAEVEAKIHQTEIEHVHFHEVGAVDAIIDVVGAVCGLWRLGIEKVYASSLNTGTGWTKSAHGLIPVPAPATMALLQGVPIYSNGIEKELVTPTGAAILTAYCHDFGPMPQMLAGQTGYGAGNHDLSIPNLLRITLGQEVEEKACGTKRFGSEGDIHQGQALMMEVNIDDMNPEFYDHLVNKLLQAGAMDVFYQNIQMKKNRPANILSILIHHHQVDQFCQLVFAETTSIGLRVYPVTKYMQPCEIMTVETNLGPVKVKVARSKQKVVNIAPEYEDCRNLAEQRQLPIKEVYDLAKYAAYRLFDKYPDDEH